MMHWAAAHLRIRSSSSEVEEKKRTPRRSEAHVTNVPLNGFSTTAQKITYTVERGIDDCSLTIVGGKKASPPSIFSLGIDSTSRDTAARTGAMTKPALVAESGNAPGHLGNVGRTARPMRGRELHTMCLMHALPVRPGDKK